MWPPAWPAVLSAGVLGGVLMAVLTVVAESEEQLATLKTLAAASTKRGIRVIKQNKIGGFPTGWDVSRRGYSLPSTTAPKAEAHRKPGEKNQEMGRG